jgi:hypothetical protein
MPQCLDCPVNAVSHIDLNRFYFVKISFLNRCRMEIHNLVNTHGRWLYWEKRTTGRVLRDLLYIHKWYLPKRDRYTIGKILIKIRAIKIQLYNSVLFNKTCTGTLRIFTKYEPEYGEETEILPIIPIKNAICIRQNGKWHCSDYFGWTVILKWTR